MDLIFFKKTDDSAAINLARFLAPFHSFTPPRINMHLSLILGNNSSVSHSFQIVKIVKGKWNPFRLPSSEG